ncbi:class II aldolase/adducin family protein [Vagococcus sp. BWB3-3]|uniref:Class II aldolase/adducin family protein n=2 Tax=Vagococcus allomyrinae TaxID=2794353 RepID=A0A940P6T7_9ENTE|nr:class II aldolase/adducin family protein [Vagococcus allomyrinae]MBP1039534.1 class II aldolase/adducin family protein [Vagococcus allomyrinae]
MICEIGKRIYDRGYVAANDGNVSVKMDDGTIFCTPTGVSKGFMQPDMIVKMDLDGNVLSDNAKPSSEVKMHLRVYRENPTVNSVVHAHPVVATSYAIAGIPLNQALCPEAVVTLGNVPVAPYATPGTQQVPDSIAPYCIDYNAVLLANHGALTWGKDLIEAYYRMESLEHFAMMTMYTGRIINQANELNCSQVGDLIEMRENMGVSSGGVPPCRTEETVATDEEALIEDVVKAVLSQLS